MQQTSFGRRVAGATPRMPSGSPDRPATLADELSPEAEAFRREIARTRGRSEGDFSDWNRRQRAGRLFAWGMSAVLTVPGAICFILDAPMMVSSGVEIGGIVLGWWLRRARKRHIEKIVRWRDPLDSQS